MIYDFKVSLPFETFYEGMLEIEADSYEEALQKIKELSNEELDERTTNWEIDLINTVSNLNDLKVYDQEGNILN
jgi:hypothetical protein